MHYDEDLYYVKAEIKLICSYLEFKWYVQYDSFYFLN